MFQHGDRVFWDYERLGEPCVVMSVKTDGLTGETLGIYRETDTDKRVVWVPSMFCQKV